jgi:hypothetical protein
MRRNIRTIALVTTVAAGGSLALAAPVGASPSASSSETSGACSAGSTFEAESELKSIVTKGRKGHQRTSLRVPAQAFEFEIRTALAGQDWTLTITDTAGLIYQSTKPSVLDDDDDSDDVVRAMRDRGGDDDGSDGDSSGRSGSDDADDDSDDSHHDGLDDSDHDSDHDSDDMGSQGSHEDGSHHDGSDDSDDDSDSSDTSAGRLAKVEWRTTGDPATGPVVFTAVNQVTAETCSTTIPGTPAAG